MYDLPLEPMETVATYPCARARCGRARKEVRSRKREKMWRDEDDMVDSLVVMKVGRG